MEKKNNRIYLKIISTQPVSMMLLFQLKVTLLTLMKGRNCYNMDRNKIEKSV
jgi:hypothetical protein